MKKPQAPQTVADINVTPMVDVMLVLLIIFMVITPMLSKGVNVDLAKTTNPIPMKDADKEDAILVAVTRNGGSMADPGSVSYLFNRKGVVIVPKNALGEDDVLAAVLDAGAEEVNDLGDAFEVISEAGDLVGVRTALQAADIDYDSADANFLPSVQVPLDEEGARKVFRLIEALEDSDDVQNVYANFDVTDEIMEKIAT